MSTLTSEKIYGRYKPQPGDEAEDVVFNSLYGLRSIELNRPKKLNALNGSMMRKITSRLLEWSKSDMANVIVMKGAGDRAFCAGGDVAALAQWNTQARTGRSVEYFADEYRLDHLIATYNKPYIAFMDGITMGGGAGLSMHAPLRIATERTVFAMPETTIGLFPDVGGSFFLPRLPGSVGTYLALTSERLMGVNAFYSGVATHYLHSTSLPSLESRLAELRFQDSENLKTRLVTINRTIEEFCTGLPHNEPMHIAGDVRRAIDRCFVHDNVEDIITTLREEEGPTKEWAEKTLETLHQRSPTSVHVTLRQMRLGRDWTISETFRRELNMARIFMEGHDFTEGVTARLIEKPPRAPRWKPESLEQIYPEDEITDAYFATPEEAKPMELLTKEDYTEYPHAWLGLPTEQEVRELVAGEEYTREHVLQYFIHLREGKQGVREIVDEILSRRTALHMGKVSWQDN